MDRRHHLSIFSFIGSAVIYLSGITKFPCLTDVKCVFLFWEAARWVGDGDDGMRGRSDVRCGDQMWAMIAWKVNKNERVKKV